MNLWAIFLTGLLTGGLTCLAVQGGLLATLVAQRDKKITPLPLVIFLGTKLVAYTFFGMLLGLLGEKITLSLTVRGILQLLVVIFMVGIALNLLNAHPVFRYFVISPPRFLMRLVRDQAKSERFFAPAILGAFTVFIPCGTTLAMMALAISSGSPLYGALVMFSFVLGTTPLFFILGYTASRLGEKLQQKFYVLAAAIILLLSAYNLNAAFTVLGLPNFADIGKKIICTVSFCQEDLKELKVGDQVSIFFQRNGYKTDGGAIRAGSKVTLNLINESGSGCIQAFTIPKLGISQIVRVGESKTISFTAPTVPGVLRFSCSMGMFDGAINVI